jgi:stringent starvation protein B
VTPSSTKPYLIRALYEWCSDNGYTPYLSVRVDESTKVPREFVKDGEIVLNISAVATRNLTVDNDLIQFSARFGGVSREVSIPIHAVAGIFARECGHGMLFTPSGEIALVQPPPAAVATPAPAVTGAPVAADTDRPPPAGAPTTGNGKPRLKVVK